MTRAGVARAAPVSVTRRSYAALQKHHAGDGAMSQNQTDGLAAGCGWLEPLFFQFLSFATFGPRADFAYPVFVAVSNVCGKYFVKPV
ncbi:hypothetical protein PCAR4_970002 [Paraburkholderia caribensis]|nr:hypothetical protein PCAR4_970002 [Paraburkholderia caribensis]